MTEQPARRITAAPGRGLPGAAGYRILDPTPTR